MIKIMIASVEPWEYQPSLGLDVTSCSIGNPSIIHFFSVVYLE
jgi:hypothetical protein